MGAMRIERDIEIEAPISTVWRTITEPDQITRWFADKVEIDLQPGGHGYMHFGEENGGPVVVETGGPVVVETVDPPTRFSFRWNWGHPQNDHPTPTNSALVEFTLTPRGDERTHLRVVESGDERLDWPDAEKTRYAEEHAGGWAKIFDRLAGLFPGTPS